MCINIDDTEVSVKSSMGSGVFKYVWRNRLYIGIPKDPIGWSCVSRWPLTMTEQGVVSGSHELRLDISRYAWQTLHCTLYTLSCKDCNVHFTHYTLYWILYKAHYALNTVHSMYRPSKSKLFCAAKFFNWKFGAEELA